MPYRDLREFIVALEANGLLARVTAEVDPEWEINGITKKLVDEALSSERGPAVLFENIKGHKVPMLSNVFVTTQRIGLALGMNTSDDREIREAWITRIKNPIPARLVKTGPCKENILIGKNVDINSVCPPVLWHQGDGAPYPGTLAMQVTRNPETGVQNIGIYRMRYFSRDETSIYMANAQHGLYHLSVWERSHPGKPMPMAAVIGTDPCYTLAACSKFVHPPGEEAYAGGLRQEPVELVKCETCDLDVPAHAEIVLEGEVIPGELRPDGPFGEYPGYLGAAQNFNVFHLKAITHRNNPIFCGEREGFPSEGQFMTMKGHEYPLWERIKNFPGVVDIHMPFAGTLYYLVVSIRKSYKGQVNQVLSWIFGDDFHFKFVVVVDEHVNIRNSAEVTWAIVNHVQPDRDIVIIPQSPQVELDVSQPYSKRGWSAKMGINATLKKELYEAEGTKPPPLCDDPKIRAKVEAQWEKYGIKL